MSSRFSQRRSRKLINIPSQRADRSGPPLAVLAVGGHSLRGSADVAAAAARGVVGLRRAGWRVVVAHGNGPQVGDLLNLAEGTPATGLTDLDVCGAATQGWIGYLLQQGIAEALRREGIPGGAVSVVTRVEVDRDDPAFHRPSKPIGPFLDERTAKARELDGWQVMEDAGRGWRRAVASPQPVRILEESVVRRLVEQDCVVITVGGGGIPVTRRVDGRFEGIAAVIDKDLAASLLARTLGAELLLICTSVRKVSLDFGRPGQREVDCLSVAQARHYLDEGRHFAEGSMAPKIRAIAEYLEGGGAQGLITSCAGIAAGLAGGEGTLFTASAS